MFTDDGILVFRVLNLGVAALITAVSFLFLQLAQPTQDPIAVSANFIISLFILGIVGSLINFWRRKSMSKLSIADLLARPGVRLIEWSEANKIEIRDWNFVIGTANRKYKGSGRASVTKNINQFQAPGRSFPIVILNKRGKRVATGLAISLALFSMIICLAVLPFEYFLPVYALILIVIGVSLYFVNWWRPRKTDDKRS
jgi:hypothetical protein